LLSHPFLKGGIILPTFNLVSEPWIPVRVRGRLELYSLEQTLLHSQEIERIEDASPLIVVALHRLLLAVLYRTLQGPENLEEVETWLEEGFPLEKIKQYLETWKPRFDLFDKARPFYQIADLDKAVFKNPIEPKSWIELVPEIRDGRQGSAIFNHENKVDAPINPDLAIRNLLVRQTFALGGLSRTFDYAAKRSPLPNAMLFIPFGSNLLQTLCYSLDPKNFALYKYDTPFWESSESLDIAYLTNVKEKEVMGCVQAYTWMSRAVKFIPRKQDDKLFIHKIYFASGIAPKFKTDSYYDPMVSVRLAQSGKNKGQFIFVQLQENKRFWRDFDSLFSQNSNEKVKARSIDNSLRPASSLKLNISLGVYGIYNGTQEAKVDFAVAEHFILPDAIRTNRTNDIHSTLTKCLKIAEEMGEGLNNARRLLAQKILVHNDREINKSDRDKISKLITCFPTASVYWSSLEQVFPKFLGKLKADFDWREVEAFWIKEILAVAERAWAATRQAAGDDAFALRAIYSAENLYIKAVYQLQNELKEKELA
jgi:CRISPR system Cascade subunit CasA